MAEWKNEVERALERVALKIATENSFTHTYNTGDKRHFLDSLRVRETTELSRRLISRRNSETYRNTTDTVYEDPYSYEGSQNRETNTRRAGEVRIPIGALGHLLFPQLWRLRVPVDASVRASHEARTSENNRWRRASMRVNPHTETRRTRGRYIVTVQHVIFARADCAVRIYPTRLRNTGAAIGGGSGAAGGGLAGAAGGVAAGAGLGAAVGAPFGGVGAIPGSVVGGLLGGAAGFVGGALAGGAVGGTGGAVIGGVVGSNLGRNDSVEITAREVFQTLSNYCYDEAENRVYCTVYEDIIEEESRVEHNPL